jgi:hypothetical protein
MLERECALGLSYGCLLGVVYVLVQAEAYIYICVCISVENGRANV